MHLCPPSLQSHFGTFPTTQLTHPTCVSQLSATVTKYLSLTLYFVPWFRAIVSWLCCFWACDGTAHSGGEHMAEELLTFMAQEVEKERGSG
jgi:hypothetical protein